ncbi:hypothetical protein SLS62_008192 [Diatrype stigma]|uniref:Uncharacterized protein n=1 Tax=Diatrype stigma TaxID=117547 RepID=A0AAN9UJS7_9PEZI
MERPEPGLIKWSPNPAFDSFIHISLTHRLIQLYEPTGHAQHGRFNFKKLTKHEEAPPLTTYDWSPRFPGLVALGTANGAINLLRIDDNSNGYHEQKPKFGRMCQAIAFNTGTLLAVGYERVRNDHCLHIYDVNGLLSHDSKNPGLPKDDKSLMESAYKLEPGVSVSSIKFFEDSPMTVVAGLKNQGIRIYDLRDPNGAVINFQTKCNNNLAIDYADQNYFASSSLDQPGVLIWDRRATSRPSSSLSYLDAVDNEELPWGASLKVDRATDVDPVQFSDRYSLIRSLRFNRDHRGMLAILSRSGQLKVLETQKVFTPADASMENSPELKKIRRSYELDLTYRDQAMKDERIVSFDWVNLSSPVLTPRAVVLRANGCFDILEKPSFTSQHLYKMNVLQCRPPDHDPVSDQEALDVEAKDLYTDASTTAEKLRGIRRYLKEKSLERRASYDQQSQTDAEELEESLMGLSITSFGQVSNRQLHEKLLALTQGAKGLPKEAQAVLDHTMLLRAKERYLFDCAENREVVADDPWLQDLWDWIAGAEESATDDGMVASGVDVGYLGLSQGLEALED